MLTSVGQAPLSQMGSTQALYPSVSLQQSYIPPVQLPSAAPILSGQFTPRGSFPQLTPPPFSLPTPQLTPQFNPQMTGQITPRSAQFNGQLTPRTAQQQTNLMTSLQEEGRRLQPQVNNVVNRVGQEAQGFFRWLFGPIRR